MIFLFPRKFKIPGLILLLIGITLGVVRFYFGIKPKLFDIKVFAIYSQYFETNYFKVISNHISEELTALFLITGLLLLCFSKEKNENESLNQLRLKSFVITFYVNTLFLLFSFTFIYGLIFINILVLNLISPFLIYLITFNWLKYKYTRSITT